VKTPERAKTSIADIATLVLAAVLPIFVLMWGMLPGNPYGYFVFLRIVVCFVAFAYVPLFVGQQRYNLVYVFGFIALLYNPIFPVHLTREKWLVLDAATIVAFVVGAAFGWVGIRRAEKRKETDPLG